MADETKKPSGLMGASLVSLDGLYMCRGCMEGVGGYCHNPGCICCRHRVDIPFTAVQEVDEQRRSEASKHTGVSASWCPVCGDCTCPRDSDGRWIDDPDAIAKAYERRGECPLHTGEHHR